MKSTGTVRRIDELGRIVLPIEYRRVLDISVRDEVEIALEENRIVLRKHETSCVFCSSTSNLVLFKGKNVCKKCLSGLKESE